MTFEMDIFKDEKRMLACARKYITDHKKPKIRLPNQPRSIMPEAVGILYSFSMMSKFSNDNLKLKKRT